MPKMGRAEDSVFTVGVGFMVEWNCASVGVVESTSRPPIAE